MGEYAQKFETRLHIAERARYEAAVEDAKGAASDGDLSRTHRFETQVALLDESINRLEAQVGGEVFEGRALTPSGTMESGRYLLVGPTVFFASSDSPAAGVVQQEVGSDSPTAIALSEDQNREIRALIESGSGAHR